MAAYLDISAEVVSAARILLQDTVDSPYRYSDTLLYNWLTEGMTELKRLRPDLLLNQTIPTFSPATPTEAITIDEMYRTALVYYVAGRAQIIDDESVQDQRGAAFLQMFNAKLSAGV